MTIISKVSTCAELRLAHNHSLVINRATLAMMAQIHPQGLDTLSQKSSLPQCFDILFDTSLFPLVRIMITTIAISVGNRTVGSVDQARKLCEDVVNIFSRLFLRNRSRVTRLRRLLALVRHQRGERSLRVCVGHRAFVCVRVHD